ncbi:MAG: NAD-glutamate dehydrogenase [Acidobacteriota bacterium]
MEWPEVYRRLETLSGERDHLKRLASVVQEEASYALVAELSDAEGIWLLAAVSDFLERLGPEGINVRVENPPADLPALGRYTLLQTAVGDRPFVVDSLRMMLRRRNLEPSHLLHPIVHVRRAADGKLLEISSEALPGGRQEAYQAFFLPRLEEEGAREELAAAALATLREVVAVTDDFAAMRREVEGMRRVLEEGLKRPESPQYPASEEILREYLAFLDWLLANNFVFLGFRRYEVITVGRKRCAQVQRGSGLGILRHEERSKYWEPVPLAALPERLQREISGPPLLLVAKANSEAPVYRNGLMDYVGLKHFDSAGEFIGESRILGLYSSRAYLQPASEIPILRRKLSWILETAEAKPGSHDYRRIVALFNSFPLGELFVRSEAVLLPMIRELMSLEEEHAVRVRFLVSPHGKGISALVSLPKEHFSSEVRKAIQDYLMKELRASSVEYRLAWGGEEDRRARLHFLFATEKMLDDVPVAELERNVIRLTRSWDDRLEEELVQRVQERGRKAAARYAPVLPSGYKAEVDPVQAALDVLALERLQEGSFEVELRDAPPERHPEPATYLRIYHAGTLALADIFPVLQNLGLRVLEQISYQFPRPERPGLLSIDIFRVQRRDGRPLNIPAEGDRVQEALLALLAGRALDDPLNELVLTGELRIRSIALLTGLRAHLFQLMPATSLRFITQTLLKYPQCAAAIFQLFGARFDPGLEEDRRQAVAQAKARFLGALEPVETVPEDQLFRFLSELVEAMVRTNFYYNKRFISWKVASRELAWIPAPRPWREIFVWSPEVEGVHLRSGPIARGGIRWSDRPDDFRTEILGLMKTQVVKNALIVPQGAKGGFVLKRAPKDREAQKDFVREQYQVFIRGLLDVVDNIVGGEPASPPDMICYDEPDTYLVVAADKGTATFSDLANAVAAEYDFWLGDAFASGGTHGYDHKKEGITARGAWECVKRHFAEMGLDPFREEFTVIGIGDMSGDVFGNGMLYTDKIRLVAAFDHRHVFLDPSPDAARSYRERKRLFELPGSSWADYDPQLISSGGGVYPRGAKAIPLSPEVQKLLGLESDKLSGSELIRAILRARADLLWNGGIGTYVKASWENDAEVGDPTNRDVRINANELRVRVIGEGGNLGLTQAARVEFALSGGRVNTDAVDNSGGVDMSDHEVNLKIALEPAVRGGRLRLAERNRLLEELAPEVARLVLANNASQAFCLSLAQREGPGGAPRYFRLQELLRREAGLDPTLERLPSLQELEVRVKSGRGYTRPELAVLLAYSKLYFKERLLGTSLLEEVVLARHLAEYFPPLIVEKFRGELAAHRLRRNIVATRLTNVLVDRWGIDAWFRVQEEASCDLDQALPAIIAVWELTGVEELLGSLQLLEGLAFDVQCRWLGKLREACLSLAVWFVLGPWHDASPTSLVERFRRCWAEAVRDLPQFLSGLEEATRWQATAKEVEELGVSAELVSPLAAADYWPALVSVVHLAEALGYPLADAGRTYFAVGEWLRLGALRDALLHSGTADPRERTARQTLATEFRLLQANLAELALGSDGGFEEVRRLFAKLPWADRVERQVAALAGRSEVDVAEGVLLRHQLFRLLPELHSLRRRADRG